MTTPEVPIVGYIPASLNEWRGKISAVLFTGGCSLRCPFCHVPDLVNGTPADFQADVIPHDALLEAITEDSWVNGIVVTGGEPAIHPGIRSLCEQLQATKKAVRLATNGLNASVVGLLVQLGKVDSVAMDLKTHFVQEDYCRLAGCPTAVPVVERVQKSLERVLEDCPDVELRTTVIYSPDGPHNQHSKQDLLDIAQYLADMDASATWFIQQFQPGDCLDNAMNSQPATPLPVLLEWLDEIKLVYPHALVRGLESL